jgi:hypothetical protein
VFWIQDGREIGALQLAVDYGSTGGQFLGAADTVQCETLVGPIASGEEDDPTGGRGVLASYNDNEIARVLSVGLITINGFGGAVDLFKCAFELPQDRSDVRFTIRVEDATDPQLDELEPRPQIGYRLE